LTPNRKLSHCTWSRIAANCITATGLTGRGPCCRTAFTVIAARARLGVLHHYGCLPIASHAFVMSPPSPSWPVAFSPGEGSPGSVFLNARHGRGVHVHCGQFPRHSGFTQQPAYRLAPGRLGCPVGAISVRAALGQYFACTPTYVLPTLRRLAISVHVRLGLRSKQIAYAQFVSACLCHIFTVAPPED
jgi:hypothetical protein